MDKVLQLELCKLQSELFRMSVDYNIDSKSFIDFFMTSSIAEHLDSEFDHLQWAGKEYIMELILNEYRDKLSFNGTLYSKETMEWIGYIYRYWHFYTNESSKDIYKQGDALTMNLVYYSYHTLDCALAIDKLKDNYMDKLKKK